MLWFSLFHPICRKTDEYWTIGPTGQYDIFLYFFLGCLPNITRNAIVNCAELVTYDLIKELILKYGLMTGEELQVLTVVAENAEGRHSACFLFWSR